MSGRVKIFFDGGCRPNPGTMEIALVAAGKARILTDLGSGSSLDAEWLALIEALRLAQDLGARERPDGFVLLGDAANVVAQANGTHPARGDALRHLHALRKLAGDTPLPRIRHIGRRQNLAGIALAARHGR